MSMVTINVRMMTVAVCCFVMQPTDIGYVQQVARLLKKKWRCVVCALPNVEACLLVIGRLVATSEGLSLSVLICEGVDFRRLNQKRQPFVRTVAPSRLAHVD